MSEEQDKPKLGRPTDYNEAIADLICERIADGESLRAICREDAMPSKASVFRWLSIHSTFSDQYARARAEQAETYADELTAIADEQEYEKVEVDGVPVAVKFDSVAVARNRLRIDTRKWVASKLKPKKYGDKVAHELTGENGGPIQVTKILLADLEDE